MALDPSYIVRVRERVSTDTTTARDFSKTLFLHEPATSTAAGTLALHAQVPSYATLEEVGADWATTSAPYRAAATYFQQSPPPGLFAVASYFSAARDGSQAGAPVTVSQANVQAFGNAAALSIFGQTFTVNVSAVTSATATATALQTAINGVTGVTGVTVASTGAFGASQTYTITVPAALASVDTLDVTVGLTGDLAEALGLTSAVAGIYARPFAADTSVATALTRANDVDNTFYMAVLSPALEGTAANITAASAWAEAGTHMFGFESSDEGALDPTNTTAPIVVVNAARRKRTFGVFTRRRDGKAISIAARFSSVNYDGAGTNINLAHKALPGTLPDDLTQAQVDLLDSRGSSAYVTIAGSPRVLFGRAAEGFIDARVWTDWITGRFQTALLDLLGNANRVPISRRGSTQLLSAVIEVCNRGLANGGFTPGQLDPSLVASVRSITGNEGFTGDLPNGYFAYVAPVDQADIDNRTAPSIYVWGLYRGGVNRINIELAIGD